MSVKAHTFRLHPGQELRSSIEEYCRKNDLAAASIVTCVAGVKNPTLRMAGATPRQQDIRRFEGDYEVVSLVGTLADFKSHLHISVSNTEGAVFGGHLKEVRVVWTAEVTILNDDQAEFSREHDSETGFEELVVKTL